MPVKLGRRNNLRDDASRKFPEKCSRTCWPDVQGRGGRFSSSIARDGQTWLAASGTTPPARGASVLVAAAVAVAAFHLCYTGACTALSLCLSSCLCLFVLAFILWSPFSSMFLVDKNEHFT